MSVGRTWGRRILSILFVAGWAISAGAADVTISARYAGASNGAFEDTTPPAGFCNEWPWVCRENRTVALPISLTKQATQGAADVRDRFYVRTPAGRTLDVVHETSGERFSLSFEVIALAYTFRDLGQEGLVPSMGDLRGGCTWLERLISEDEGPRNGVDLMAIASPASPPACYVHPWFGDNGKVLQAEYGGFGIGYRLYMPQPTRMRQGLYRGSLQLGIGPGGDFDFGNQVTNLSSDTLTINFELDVQHQFELWFPPGSERAVLEPPGGWQAWLGGRGTPTRLYRDLPLRLWSTGPFKVYKLCQYEAADRCGIRNGASHQVPVQVALTLPDGVQHGSGPVRRLPIPTGRTFALDFQQVMPVSNRPGQLHFEVAQQDLPAMLAQAGTHYEGLVTVVFDSEL